MVVSKMKGADTGSSSIWGGVGEIKGGENISVFNWERMRATPNPSIDRSYCLFNVRSREPSYQTCNEIRRVNVRRKGLKK